MVSDDMMVIRPEVHPKVWGEEHWVVNGDYCGKKLILNKKFRCSLHEHRHKDETFYVIKGCVSVEEHVGVLGWTILKPGDAYRVHPGAIHRFNGLEDSEIIEFSTFHDEDDSYRIEESGEIPDDLFHRMLKSVDDH